MPTKSDFTLFGNNSICVCLMVFLRISKTEFIEIKEEKTNGETIKLHVAQTYSHEVNEFSLCFSPLPLSPLLLRHLELTMLLALSPSFWHLAVSYPLVVSLSFPKCPSLQLVRRNPAPFSEWNREHSLIV